MEAETNLRPTEKREGRTLINVSKFTAPHEKAGAFHSLVAPHRFIDDAVFTTKGNALGILLKAQGVDYEALTEDILESHAKRISAAWRSLDEQFRIFQYLIKEDRADIASACETAKDVVRRTVSSRNDHLKTIRAVLNQDRLRAAL